MKQVTYTHVDGSITVFTETTPYELVRWDWKAQANITTAITVKDWGLQMWARERLSSADFEAFKTTSETEWANSEGTITPIRDLDSFKHYWTLFVNDPNVAIQE